MMFEIDDLDGETWELRPLLDVELKDVGVIYEDEDLIYLNGSAFRLSSARRIPPDAESAAQVKHDG